MLQGFLNIIENLKKWDTFSHPGISENFEIM